MDDVDRQLIGLLRTNARATVASLAKSLGVSRGTVQNRMARLERDGTIAGYTVRLRPETEPQRVAAFMTISVEGSRAKEEKVLRTLRGDPNVTALYTTNGRWDLVAELAAQSLPDFEQVLNRIRRIDGIAQTETSILLSAYKV